MATVTVRSDGGVAQRIETAGGHEILVDEPPPVGEDRGPDPYALLLGAIGACAAMTATLYARRKGWPLEGVEVELSHERVHTKDCAGDGRCERVYRRLTLLGPLDEAQRARISEIAARCPVARSVAAGIEIVAR